ncbi:MAG TPA: polyhydroxyalkanoic acid synthase, partial [Stenotrophomonas sp.]|nr:polyhydroxyalkanoic acid synthase [Stenotrophomonas sp.]
MSTIDIRHAHTLPAENARKAIEDVAAKLSERFGLQSNWVGDVLN